MQPRPATSKRVPPDPRTLEYVFVTKDFWLVTRNASVVYTDEEDHRLGSPLGKAANWNGVQAMLNYWLGANEQRIVKYSEHINLKTGYPSNMPKRSAEAHAIRHRINYVP